MANILPKQIKVARESAELTPLQAAELVYSSPKIWRQWEKGNAKIHPAIYELFLIKIKRLKLARTQIFKNKSDAQMMVSAMREHYMNGGYTTYQSVFSETRKIFEGYMKINLEVTGKITDDLIKLLFNHIYIPADGIINGMSDVIYINELSDNLVYLLVTKENSSI